MTPPKSLPDNLTHAQAVEEIRKATDTFRFLSSSGGSYAYRDTTDMLAGVLSILDRVSPEEQRGHAFTHEELLMGMREMLGYQGAITISFKDWINDRIRCADPTREKYECGICDYGIPGGCTCKEPTPLQAACGCRLWPDAKLEVCTMHRSHFDTPTEPTRESVEEVARWLRETHERHVSLSRQASRAATYYGPGWEKDSWEATARAVLARFGRKP